MSTQRQSSAAHSGRLTYPRTDSERAMWFHSFADQLAQESDAAGLTDAQLKELKELAASYDQALLAATNPSTRTAIAIEAKNDARDQAMQAFRTIINQIRTDLRVDESVLGRLGIVREPQRARKPVAAPTTAPLLTFTHISSSGIHLRYADARSPEARAKPPGVLHMQLCAVVSDEPDVNPNHAVPIGNFTRTPFVIRFGEEDRNKHIALFGRWCTRTGLTGPWSNPVCMFGTATGPEVETFTPGTGQPANGSCAV